MSDQPKPLTAEDWFATPDGFNCGTDPYEMAEAYAAYRIAALEAQLELAYIALREIGESAVIDWQDKLVGLVDGALKNDTTQVEYWASAKQWKNRAEAAEARERELREANKELMQTLEEIRTNLMNCLPLRGESKPTGEEGRDVTSR